ncbi:MAG: hypothetical protein LBQ19_05390 [Synergistaceae bacterium]|jgi:hypothetical protein|nr:hypothetical protein [Synergistaceae bacterium]
MRTYELDMRGLFGAMIVLSALLLFSGPDAFAYDEGGRENAVRVAEFSNSPSAQFLLMALNRSFESAEKRPSLWRSLPSETEADRANLKVVGESGDYDIWFSSDGSIVRNAFGQGLLKSFSPVFEEEIILAGPIGSSEFSGMSALDAMK